MTRNCPAFALVGVFAALSAAQAQTPAFSPTHVVIPFLANAAKPGDLSFEGGECELGASGAAMTCEFQQVFLTTSDVAPDTCLITTNRYERRFQRQGSARWISREGPSGACGVIDVTTLDDEGGVRWTMETRKTIGVANPPASCSGLESEVETLSWRNLRRPLPCRFVQPGGLSR